MHRPRRAATKVTNFRKYHLSGDLDTELQGRVESRVTHFEMGMTPEELQKQLEQEREASNRLKEDTECLRLQNELEAEKLKQSQWRVAMEQLQVAKETALSQHEEYLKKLKEASAAATADTSSNILEWFHKQMAELNKPGATPSLTEEQERQRKEQETREAQIRDLREQQEHINQKLAELEGGGPPQKQAQANNSNQEDLLHQLKAALTGKKEEDSNRFLLRSLLANQNKVPGDGGYPHIETLTLQCAGGIRQQHGRLARQPQQAGRR